MTGKMLRSLTLFALSLLLTINQVALAGPPLLCWPYQIGEAKSLPWGGGSWHAARADYDIKRLADDTLALLGPDTPVLVRMETLRRATIYAQKDHRVAAELHARLAARAQGKSAALALFDLGYLKEAYKQSVHMKEMGRVSRMGVVASDMDGYSLVVRAISLRGHDPEMEFAAALISLSPRKDSHNDHLRRAIAGASEGSLLARNLVSHFSDRGKSFAELRANLGAGKN
jgi:hypothetical protein